MRLINFGLGEITDRLTILSLKRLFGEQAGRDISHWRNEQTALLVQTRSRSVQLELTLELAAVNAALWHKEDELRRYREMYGVDGHDRNFTDRLVVACAFRIQELNDQRASLIQKINEAAGDGSAPEKL